MTGSRARACGSAGHPEDDDGSVDGTPEIAASAGARAVLLYLDGDLHDLDKDLVARMTRPILEDQADFVKAKFGRTSGRVIVTDSYQVAAEIIRRRIFADFGVAHLMRFQKGRCTGEIAFSRAMTHPEGCMEHEHRKVNVAKHLVSEMEIADAAHEVVADSLTRILEVPSRDP